MRVCECLQVRPQTSPLLKQICAANHSNSQFSLPVGGPCFASQLKKGSSKSREPKNLLPSILTFPKFHTNPIYIQSQQKILERWGPAVCLTASTSRFGAWSRLTLLVILSVPSWLHGSCVTQTTSLKGPWNQICIGETCWDHELASWPRFIACLYAWCMLVQFLEAWVLPVSRTTLIDPVCFLVLKILVQGHGAYQSSCFESFCWDSCMSICTLFHSGSWIVVLRLLFWLVGYFDTYYWLCIVFDSYNSMIIHVLFDIITLCVYTMHSTYHDLCQCIYEL